MLPNSCLASVSSYQFDCLVASLVSVIWALRSPAYFVVERSLEAELREDELGLLVELAVTTAVFRRRLMLRPPSSSVDV